MGETLANKDRSETAGTGTLRTAEPTHPVVTGAAVLASEGFASLRAKRVGLITNQTGTVGGEHLIDLLSRAEGVALAAIFAPEHGVRGRVEAGESVESTVDTRTGVPIHSLYGKTRSPTPEMLRNVDLLVFDIQDIGARFYTYVSTMGLAMQSAAEARIPFLVLDRPNPLGGDYVSGFVAEDSQRSFVGLYPIPIAHGMTSGELARMIQGERMLPGLEQLELSVQPMQGWKRWMRWPDTGLDWAQTSPNIASFESALLFAGVGLLEATTMSEGRGTDHPFELIGADWVDAPGLLRDLNAQGLPGVTFEAATFMPRSIPGKAMRPRFEGRSVAGIRVLVTDYRTIAPVETGVILLRALHRQAREREVLLIDRPQWLAKLAGTEGLAALLSQGASGAEIVASWTADEEKFRLERRQYLLYE